MKLLYSSLTFWTHRLYLLLLKCRGVGTKWLRHARTPCGVSKWRRNWYVCALCSALLDRQGCHSTRFIINKHASRFATDTHAVRTVTPSLHFEFFLSRFQAQALYWHSPSLPPPLPPSFSVIAPCFIVVCLFVVFAYFFVGRERLELVRHFLEASVADMQT